MTVAFAWQVPQSKSWNIFAVEALEQRLELRHHDLGHEARLLLVVHVLPRDLRRADDRAAVVATIVRDRDRDRRDARRRVWWWSWWWWDPIHRTRRATIRETARETSWGRSVRAHPAHPLQCVFRERCFARGRVPAVKYSLGVGLLLVTTVALGDPGPQPLPPTPALVAAKDVPYPGTLAIAVLRRDRPRAPHLQGEGRDPGRGRRRRHAALSALDRGRPRAGRHDRSVRRAGDQRGRAPASRGRATRPTCSPSMSWAPAAAQARRRVPVHLAGGAVDRRCRRSPREQLVVDWPSVVLYPAGLLPAPVSSGGGSERTPRTSRAAWQIAHRAREELGKTVQQARDVALQLTADQRRGRPSVRLTTT